MRRLSSARRMPASAHPQTTGVAKLGTIELQRFDCRPADGCEADNRVSICAPFEVVVPLLASGMVERNSCITRWIDC